MHNNFQTDLHLEQRTRGALDSVNFGCFVSNASRCEFLHCNAYANMNKGAYELAPNSANRAHPCDLPRIVSNVILTF